MTVFHKPQITPTTNKLEVTLKNFEGVPYKLRLLATYIWQLTLVNLIFYVENIDFSTYAIFTIGYALISALVVHKLEKMKENKMIIFYSHIFVDSENRYVEHPVSFYPHNPGVRLEITGEVIVNAQPYMEFPDELDLIRVLRKDATFEEFYTKLHEKYPYTNHIVTLERLKGTLYS